MADEEKPVEESEYVTVRHDDGQTFQVKRMHLAEWIRAGYKVVEG